MRKKTVGCLGSDCADGEASRGNDKASDHLLIIPLPTDILDDCHGKNLVVKGWS